MEHLIETRAAALGCRYEPTRPVFDLARESPPLLEAIARGSDHLRDTLHCVTRQIPLPGTAATSTEGHFYRLANHNRSFCYSITPEPSFLDSPVLVFKGTEPLLADFPALVDWMCQAPLRKSSRVMADHFPLSEGKIPGALSLKEAYREAEIALEIQQKHLRHYGEPARMPTPLLIHEFPESRRAACAAVLRQKLSAPAFQRIEALLSDGLAVYVYHYPAAPVRSNYWGGMGSPELTEYVQKHFDERMAISRWAQLLVRLLYLGYLPYSVRNEGLGACMDFGNATLDGGFCDPDSIMPIAECPDDEFFREGLIQSVLHLQNTVQLVLGLSSRTDLYPSSEDFVCAQYLRNLLIGQIASEARPQLRLDERVMRLLAPRSLADVQYCTARKKRMPWYTQFAKSSN